jgi:TolA-binding protein
MSMSGRSLPWILMIATACVLRSGVALAQDVPGIEICTAEKKMERRTSCLQSNVNFLQRTISRLVTDSGQKIDAANRRIAVLESTVAELQKAVAELQAARKKPPQSTESGKGSAKENGK